MRKTFDIHAIAKIALELGKGINILTMVIGVLLTSLYLNAIRLGDADPNKLIFFTGVSFCIISMIISYSLSTKEKVAKFSLLSLYILTFSLLTIYSFRYYFFSSDLAGEYFIASETLNTNSWPMSLLAEGWGPRGGRYASSLSVSILPPILSKVTGIPLMLMFKFVMPAIGAFVSIGIYLLVKEIYGDKKLALLSAMLFSVSHLQVFMLSYMFRRQIGHLLLVIMLWMIFRFSKHKKAFSKIVIIPLFLGVTLSNYVVSDFGFLALLGIMITPFAAKLLRTRNWSDKVILSWKMFLLYCAVMVSWLWFAANKIFWEHVIKLEASFSMIVTYGPNYIWRVITTGDFLPSTGGGRAVGSGLTSNQIVNIWYYFVVLLPAIGWLYTLFKFKRNSKEIAWISCFFLTYGFFIYQAFYGTEGAALPWASGFIVFCVFTAISVHRASWHRWHQKVFALLSIILICTSLPLNLSLPNDQVLHFHSENQISPEIRDRQFDISFKDSVSSQWINSYVPHDEWITCDTRGFFSVLMIINHLNHALQNYPRFSLTSQFLMLDNSFVFHGVWFTSVWGFSTKNVSFSQIATNNSIIYSNGETFLLQRD